VVGFYVVSPNGGIHRLPEAGLSSWLLSPFLSRLLSPFSLAALFRTETRERFSCFSEGGSEGKVVVFVYSRHG
jgi:hypothetical protein